MNINNRTEGRLIPEDLTFVALRPEFNQLGRILNISKGGLCFRYLSIEGKVGDSIYLDIDIFIGNSGYYLPGLSCKLIYDFEMTKKTTSLASMKFRLCGLKFISPGNKQIDQLEFYLNSHTQKEE